MSLISADEQKNKKVEKSRIVLLFGLVIVVLIIALFALFRAKNSIKEIPIEGDPVADEIGKVLESNGDTITAFSDSFKTFFSRFQSGKGFQEVFSTQVKDSSSDATSDFSKNNQLGKNLFNSSTAFINNQLDYSQIDLSEITGNPPNITVGNGNPYSFNNPQFADPNILINSTLSDIDTMQSLIDGQLENVNQDYLNAISQTIDFSNIDVTNALFGGFNDVNFLSTVGINVATIQFQNDWTLAQQQANALYVAQLLYISYALDQVAVDINSIISTMATDAYMTMAIDAQQAWFESQYKLLQARLQIEFARLMARLQIPVPTPIIRKPINVDVSIEGELSGSYYGTIDYSRSFYDEVSKKTEINGTVTSLSDLKVDTSLKGSSNPTSTSTGVSSTLNNNFKEKKDIDVRLKIAGNVQGASQRLKFSESSATLQTLPFSFTLETISLPNIFFDTRYMVEASDDGGTTWEPLIVAMLGSLSRDMGQFSEEDFADNSKSCWNFFAYHVSTPSDIFPNPSQSAGPSKSKCFDNLDECRLALVEHIADEDTVTDPSKIDFSDEVAVNALCYLADQEYKFTVLYDETSTKLEHKTGGKVDITLPKVVLEFPKKEIQKTTESEKRNVANQMILYWVDSAFSNKRSQANALDKKNEILFYSVVANPFSQSTKTTPMKTNPPIPKRVTVENIKIEVESGKNYTFVFMDPTDQKIYGAFNVSTNQRNDGSTVIDGGTIDVSSNFNSGGDATAGIIKGFEDGLIQCGKDTMDPCDFNDVVEHIYRLFQLAFSLISPLAAIAFMYTGIRLITSQDSGSKKSEIKTTFKNVFIGAAILMLAWLMIVTFFKLLGVDASYLLFAQ